MKKSVLFLLAALLLTGTAFTTQAQNKKLSAVEAHTILQKTSGNWQIEYAMWQPQLKEFKKSSGEASFNKQQSHYTREEFKITRPDGTIEEGEGFLTFCDDKNRFEFVQVDNSCKSIVLMAGQWYPENNTLVLTSQNGAPLQLQYVFFEDGSFMKSYRAPDNKGNYTIVSQYHYKAKKVTS